MKTIHVWYMRPQQWRERRKPDVANLASTHIELMTYEWMNDGPVKLDNIYHAMQGEIWSPNGEARELIKSKGLEHTSMSVGDVIVVDGEAHVIASFGFDSLGRVEG